MIRNLSHLHDETENVGVVVQENTLSNVSVEFTLPTRHNAVGEVILSFTKELAVDVDLLDRQLHRVGVVFLQAAQHDPVCHQPEFSESHFAGAAVAVALDGVQELLVGLRQQIVWLRRKISDLLD